jgi:hypothetical protein
MAVHAALIKRLCTAQAVLVLAGLLFLPSRGLCFDYQSYESSTLGEIGRLTKKTAGEELASGAGKGMDYYTLKYRLRFRLKEYPEEITERTSKALALYWKVIGLNPEHRKLFTHQMEAEEGTMRFTLAVQGQLVPHLKEEVRPGRCLDLYVMLGVYDYFSERTILLVNEFDASDTSCDSLAFNVSLTGRAASLRP